MVILAGPAVNVLIAFLIVWALFLARVRPCRAPAWRPSRAGRRPPRSLKPGDLLVSVDGVGGSPSRDPQPAGHPPLRRQAGQRLRCRHTGADRGRRDGRLLTLRGQAALQRGRVNGRWSASSSADTRRRSAPRTPRRRASAACGTSPRRRYRSSRGSSSPRSASSSAASSASTPTRSSRSPRARRRPPGAGADLAVARRDQPVPVPAPGRRPRLLGAGREGARAAHPLRRSWSAPAPSASC